MSPRIEGHATDEDLPLLRIAYGRTGKRRSMSENTNERDAEQAELRAEVERLQKKVTRVEELAYTPRPAGPQQDTALLEFIDTLRAALKEGGYPNPAPDDSTRTEREGDQ